MKISEITDYLESIAPPALQESYDNCGLITGHRDMEVNGALVTLDCTEAVVDEAIANKCNFIIAHHPIVFSGLKKINGKNYVERVIIKAIKNDIAIYAIHTSLDNVPGGVNAKIAEKLGLVNMQILAPKNGLLRKLITFCPDNKADEVREALFAAGAGQIGNYDSCSFNTAGTGTFRAGENTDPYVGKKGELHKEPETRIELVYPAHIEGRLVSALLKAHPYEEVAYDLVPLANSWAQAGSGMVGELPEAVSLPVFLEKLKKDMQTACIRYTPVEGKTVKKVAVCGGSGSFLLGAAMGAGADVLVTADFKYHQFFDGENRLVIADIGHYESEQFTKDLLGSLINKKFPTFAVRLSGINTNPINYYT
ncbi:MAG: dinuclear metal center protein [Bacteroidetes bacterium]|nr:MAG: dinuclear metal center protein [Bacteroidota bacterium]